MSVKPNNDEIDRMMKQIQQLKAALPQVATTVFPDDEEEEEPAPAQPAAAPAPAPKQKREPNAWAKQVKHYQELEKARGRNITLKVAMKELSEHRKALSQS